MSPVPAPEPAEIDAHDRRFFLIVPPNHGQAVADEQPGEGEVRERSPVLLGDRFAARRQGRVFNAGWKARAGGSRPERGNGDL